MFTNKKREGINRFVCDVSLYVVKTPKASIKYHKPSFPIIPFGIVAYSFVGQPFSKQLYITRGGPWRGIVGGILLTQKTNTKQTKKRVYFNPELEKKNC